jgi:penicillin-binding protein 1C
MGALTRLPGEWRRWGPPALLIAMILVYAALNVLTAPPSLPDYAQVRRDWRPSEAWLYDREGKLLDRIRVDYQARRLGWTPLDAINPAMRDAVIRGEDRRFATHEGVDWLALGNAALARLRGDPARGASTISMQLAAYLSPQMAAPGARGWRDKLRQMRAAWALEEDWSKAEILEAYLNLAPYRGEAQGIAAAARMTLFGKPPVAPARPATRRSLRRRTAARSRRRRPKRVAFDAPARLAPERCADCSARLPALASWMLIARKAPRARSRPCAASREPSCCARPARSVATTLDTAVQRAASLALRPPASSAWGETRARDGAVIVRRQRERQTCSPMSAASAARIRPPRPVDGADAPRQAGSTLEALPLRIG